MDFVEKWPVMNSNDLAFILISYLMFVLKIGPMIMEKRAPLQLRGILIAYNMSKIINSGILTYKFFFYIVDKGLFPKKCNHDEVTLHVIAGLYWKYFATKLLDLMDTVFFIVRKKSSQVTFLHVYHHTFMVIISWTSLKYDPSDHWAFMAVLNCFVHTSMYTYYCLAALGPSYAKYLWWKKYLTRMQLVQFVLVLGHVMLQTYRSQCPMHAVTYWVGCSNLFLFIILFADFYHKRYGKSRGLNAAEFVCTGQSCD
ncbi:very long chain fatty acid elongase 7-like isoform X2 [Choristoneura fumiferana]|uniref:very long chain fatty acid elongase 7-like isoform X2 n=1 Tax=Choristoneura fumiferana TaxID=7141 RepID=UPI003D158B33